MNKKTISSAAEAMGRKGGLKRKLHPDRVEFAKRAAAKRWDSVKRVKKPDVLAIMMQSVENE